MLHVGEGFNMVIMYFNGRMAWEHGSEYNFAS